MIDFNKMDIAIILISLIVFVVALILSLSFTPVVKIFAKNVGAMDVPKDNRRMHSKPIPRMGGLAIFLSFVICVFAFIPLDSELGGILLGAVILIVLGAIDDIVSLNPWIKLVIQILAAIIPVTQGVSIDKITNFFGSTEFIEFGSFAAPITVFWIVLLINAVNFIDGLDGLACGVSTIAVLSMFVIAISVQDTTMAVMLAILAGACFGFIPYNFNPAKIFMGDTGAMFLGYILAAITVQGLFKLYAVVSFAVPFLVLGLPIFETVVTVTRRLLKGKSPFKADRGHIHHRLIDFGLNQKQVVAILYTISGILGLAAVITATSGKMKAIVIIIAVVIAVIIGLYFYFIKHSKNNYENGGKK